MIQGRGISLEEVQSALQAAREEVASVIAQQQRLAESAESSKRSIPSLRPDPAALFNAARYLLVLPAHDFEEYQSACELA